MLVIKIFINHNRIDYDLINLEIHKKIFYLFTRIYIDVIISTDYNIYFQMI
jgi:hypothetical protein